MAVRRSLLWALAGAGVLSVVAVWRQPVPLVAATVEPTGPAARPAVALPGVVSSLAGAPVVPGRVERDALETAKSDPFFVTATAPTAAKEVTAPVSSLPRLVDTLPPPPPPPPPMTHRFVGAMRTPEGTRMVYLSDGDTQVPVNPGTVLRSGYAVESAGEHEIRLVLPGTEHRATVPLPSAP